MSETQTQSSTRSGLAGESGRVRLISAAAAEFSEHGFAGASISAIAARAGMSKSTVFHHFETKQSLYMAVIGEAASEFGQKMDNVLSLDRDVNGCIKAFQIQHLEHLQRHAEVARLILRELQDNDSELAVSLVRDVLARNFNRLVEYLDRASAAGLIRKDFDSHATALALFSANVMYFQNRAMLKHLPGFDLADDPKAYAEAVTKLIINGLGLKESNP